MNIIKTSKVTGVTKSEIKFYQEKGLIEPEKNKKNGQRDYNDNDIDIIMLTYALRIIGFNIDIIKQCLNDMTYLFECMVNTVKELKTIFSEQQEVINAIDRIENNEKIEGSLDDILLVANAVDEYKKENDDNYIFNTILKSFPGNYGKLIMLQYGHYLTVKLDNEDKKQCFKMILKYIDNLNNFKINKNMNIMLESLNDDILYALRDEKLKTINTVINNDLEEIEKIKSNIISFVNLAKDDEEFKKAFIKNKNKGKTLEDCLKQKSYYDDFIMGLKTISELYGEYTKVIANIEKDLGVKYDEDGLIYLE